MDNFKFTTPPDFNKIPQFPHCNYRIDVAWNYLETQIAMEEAQGLDLNPDFQRGHVWTKEQQSAYVEYVLRGGQSGKELYFNCANFGHGKEDLYVIVDGKQRLQAVRQFMRDEVPAFGYLRSEYSGNMRGHTLRLSWNVAALETRAEILKWYLDFNSGGSIHTQEELCRVRQLLEREREEAAQ